MWFFSRKSFGRFHAIIKLIIKKKLNTGFALFRCSELVKASEKISLNSDQLDSNGNGGKQKRKKRVEEGGLESSPYQPNVKILRSMKRKKDLPRRSTRLQTKVFPFDQFMKYHFIS